MDVFDLYAKISLDSKGYEKGLDTAKTNFDGFKTHVGDALKAVAKITAAATATVAGASIAIGKSVVTNAKEIAAYGDDIDKMSQKMGMSAETYQEWDAVMQHSGTSIESMKASMKTLANAAQTNNKAFEQLGITEKELKSLNQEELFAKTIEKLQKVDDTTQRTYLAGKLLGRGATELGALLNTSAEDTQKMKERVHQLGGVMSNEGVKAAAKFQDNLQDMKTALSGLKRGIFNDTLPAFNDLMDGFTKLIAGEEGAEDKIDSGMKKLVTSVDKTVPKIQKLTETLLPKAITIGSKLVTEIAKSLPKLIAEIAPILFNAGVDIVTGVGKGIFETLENADLAGGAKTLTEKVNDMISSVDTAKGGQRFADVLNKIIGAAFNVSSTFNFSELAKKLTDFMNNALNNVNWGQLGKTVSNAWKGKWDFIGTALNNIDWEGVGEAISEFINNIDWWGIIDSVFKVIGTVIKNAPDLLWSVIKNLDFENAAGMFALFFAPKMAGNLLSFFKTNAGTKSTLTQAGTTMGNQIGGGLTGQGGTMATGLVGKISSGISTAATLAKAFAIGWTIGTQIKKGLDAIGWGQWIDDKINSFMSVVTAAERAQATANDIKAQNLEQLTKYKKMGFTHLTEKDIEMGSQAYIKAYNIAGLLQKYAELSQAGYTATRILNDVSLYEDLMAGKLPTKVQEQKRYVPSTSERIASYQYSNAYQQVSASMGYVPTSVLNQQAKIYLDTGKLVGGTGNTRAQQTNYTARGYAQ